MQSNLEEKQRIELIKLQTVENRRSIFDYFAFRMLTIFSIYRERDQ